MFSADSSSAYLARTYIFNPGWAKPTLVFEAGFDF